jgi:hypothetical protein
MTVGTRLRGFKSEIRAIGGFTRSRLPRQCPSDQGLVHSGVRGVSSGLNGQKQGQVTASRVSTLTRNCRSRDRENRYCMVSYVQEEGIGDAADVLRLTCPSESTATSGQLSCSGRLQCTIERLQRRLVSCRALGERLNHAQCLHVSRGRT